MTTTAADIRATLEERADTDGPYWAILLGARMLAYCDDKASAELVVAAVNMANGQVLAAAWAGLKPQ